jgi:prepilin-type N-terminal cleavage/methylation domain-containing protein
MKFSLRFTRAAERGRRATCLRRSGLWHGFSLVELLLVMALIGILSVLTVPAISAIRGGHVVTQEGQLLNDQINLARQMALSRSRETELRLISYPGPAGDSWAVQICESESGKPLHRLIKLEDNVVIGPSSELSPLLQNLESSNASYPRLASGTCEYRALKFRPNGRVKGKFPAREDYLTVHLRNDPTPSNYFTLQIQSLSGRIVVHRP